MAPLEPAVQELADVLRAREDAPEWRWLVRGRLSQVRQALAAPQPTRWDGWLSARAGCSDRERHRLLARVSALAAVALDKGDSEVVRGQLDRLVRDLQRHVQRMHDLYYDRVALELGGSE